MNVRDRIVEYLNFKGVTITKAEQELKWSKSSLLKSNNISSDRLGEFILFYKDVSSSWLLTGEGDMLREGGENEEGIKMIEERYAEAIPLVEDIKATCGTPDGFSVAIKKDDCTPIIIPGLNGEFAIRAKGRSMINRKNPEKSINENNIIVCNRWTSRSYIRWGEVYALATNDGVVVKQVVPSEQEGYVRCVSFNEEEGYKAFELPVLEISDWAIVVGVVNIALFA